MSEGAVLAALRRARLAAFRAERLCLSETYSTFRGFASAAVPIYLINIHQKRLILQRPALPASYARPAIIFCSFHQAGANRILMNIIRFLYQSGFRRYQLKVWMVIPKRIFMLAVAAFTLKLLQGGIEALLFQKIDHAMA